MSLPKICLMLSLVAISFLSAAESRANTVCTYVPDSEEMPVPMGQRESQRTVRTRVFASLIERGDVQAGKGRIARAASYYLDVFEGFQHQGSSWGRQRCAEPRIYQEAADKLRAVAIPYANKLMADGYYENARKYDDLSGGALYLLLYSNAYDAFIEASFEYAVSELHERDVDDYIQGLLDWRLRRLKQVANTTMWEDSGLVDDIAPLLDEELAAFDRLDGFQERLLAHLRPLYPKITDYWLAEETRLHSDLISKGGFVQQMQLKQLASGAIRSGISRLREHPREIQRLKARGNQRGEAFMSQQEYELASAYFAVTGNKERLASADEHVRRIGDERVRKVVAAGEAYIESMKKTDDEKAVFEEEADEMAKEFGFDLDD